MGAVGIIAEYNPLHRGHLRHLELTRRAAPDRPVVVCLSGNWVQRGDCAVADKWTRARWAVQAGADLVLELPTVFALASAERFARGGVGLLAAAGVDVLSFGCETPDLTPLQTLADSLNHPGFDTALRPYLDQGLSFPAARQRAAADLVGAEAGRLLAQPNNNLAVEYLRAIPAHITPLPIPRAGVHDGPLAADNIAAAPLRQLLRSGQVHAAAPYLAQPWAGPVYHLRRLERGILAALRTRSPQQLEALPDGGDSLGQRLWKAAREADSLDALLRQAATKRLTLARARRVALWAFLGLTAADRPPAPRYLRVLAMNRRGAVHLSSLRDTAPLPVLTKPAHHKDLLALEARLTDLFSLCAPRPLPCGQEFRHSPAVLPL